MSAAARALVERGLNAAEQLVAPAWCWAEVGTALRKKVARRLISEEEAEMLWVEYAGLPIEYVGGPELQRSSWQTARRYGLPTLYDAAFLACTEITGATEFWTADRELLRRLGDRRPGYVRELQM